MLYWLWQSIEVGNSSKNLEYWNAICKTNKRERKNKIVSSTSTLIFLSFFFFLFSFFVSLKLRFLLDVSLIPSPPSPTLGVDFTSKSFGLLASPLDTKSSFPGAGKSEAADLSKFPADYHKMLHYPFLGPTSCNHLESLHIMQVQKAASFLSPVL